MIVVVLGGLAALAVVGVSSLGGDANTLAVVSGTTIARTGATAATGSNAPVDRPGRGVACVASADAARAAAAVFYVSAGAYPTTWTDLTTGSEPSLRLPPGVKIDTANTAQLDGYQWKLVMAADGRSAPTFTCRVTS